MKTKMTYDELNDLAHAVADNIDSAVDGNVDRCAVNDMLTNFLNARGVEFIEEEEEELTWDKNELQFARLICEIVAAGSDLNFRALMDSMNLDIKELHELFARAETVFEAAKEKITNATVE